MTTTQRQVSDLAARWLIAFLFAVQAGQGTYIYSVSSDVREHHTAEGVHETPDQKESRVRSVAGEMISDESTKTREDIRELRAEVKRGFEELRRQLAAK